MLVVVLGAHSATGRAELAAQLLDKGFRSLGLGRVTVDQYLGTAQSIDPINMRAEVCGRRKGHEAEDVAEAGEDAPSALGPRVRIMDPVRVVTISAPAAAPKAIGGKFPVPRPRPESTDTALHVQAYSPALQSPSADAIGEAIRQAPGSLP
jgi:D-alanyl-D-alanine carboxypeptidase